jgi:hypothetical protein
MVMALKYEFTIEDMERWHEIARKKDLRRYYNGFCRDNYEGDKLIIPPKPRTESKTALLRLDKEHRKKRQREWESKLTTSEKEKFKATTVSIDDLPVHDRIPFLIYWHGRQKCELEGRYRFAKECVHLFYAMLDEIIKRRDFE